MPLNSGIALARSRTGAARERRPLAFFFFDCLYREGDGALIDLPYGDRFGRLERMIEAERLLPRQITGSTEAAERFLARALDAGHEGLMAKSLEAPYVALDITPGRGVLMPYFTLGGLDG